MIFANYVAYMIALLGGVNWGLVGIFNFNFVAWMCGGSRTGWAIAIYVLVMLACIWLVISPILSRGMLDLGCRHKKMVAKSKKEK